jgi:transcriptional regulator with GAF, ATPase, and Fis domain
MLARATERTVVERARVPRRQPSAQAIADLPRLIGELSARFVSSEPDALDDLIVESLHRIAASLQLDAAVVWQRAAEEACAIPSHAWVDRHRASASTPLALVSAPDLTACLQGGEGTFFADIDTVEEAAGGEVLRQQGFRAAVVFPVTSTHPGGLGVLAFGCAAERDWSTSVVEDLRLVSGVIAQALARKASHDKLQKALAEIDRLRTSAKDETAEIDTPTLTAGPDPSVVRAARFHHQLATENLYLRRQVQELGVGPIIGHSRALRGVLEQIRQVAATDSTVLLLGETGTGKELLATHLHEMSARRSRVMVRVNCAAIPSTLIESELFGREKGAFTGALARQVGRFELANHSTIFLDEIGDLPQEVQVKLLRVLEERQIERLGSPLGIKVNVRIIAATHRNLEQRIASGGFREDLFYRLNVFPIVVPPLRERPEDIPLLVWRFVEEFSKAFGKRIDTISRENMTALQQYSWPGNIRELRNVVERAMISATDNRLSIVLPTVASQPGKAVKMVEVEREHLRGVLEGSRWRIRGIGGAAERLGLKPTTLETRMAKLGLFRPKH